MAHSLAGGEGFCGQPRNTLLLPLRVHCQVLVQHVFQVQGHLQANLHRTLVSLEVVDLLQCEGTSAQRYTIESPEMRHRKAGPCGSLV